MSFLLGVLVLVPAADAGQAAKTITLHLGESVTVSGTKMVCQYGGLARETAVSCGISGALPGFIPGTSGFSLNEKEVSAFDVNTAGSSAKPTKIVKPARTYKEPTATRQRYDLPTTLKFKSVGSIVPGDIVRTEDLWDINCFSYIPKGQRRIRVGCTIVDQNNYFLVGSYAGSTSEVDTELVQFDANRVGKSLFLRNQPCLPRTKDFRAFTKQTVRSINGLERLGVKAKAPLKKAANLVQVEDFSTAAAALQQINVGRLLLAPKKKATLKKRIATLVNSLAPKCR